ncbi:HEPN domain-containing protein [Sulfitobacter noctilucae]|uniref:HEPN domain-containing protein n=1 Tax=Sulfitobacter noctilucae TaxID=1342302 RepID=UPI0013781479
MAGVYGGNWVVPSNSRQNFKRKLLPDVTKLLQTHEELSPPGRGRRHLGHITRSGVLSLCSAWELYIEDVTIECANFLVDTADVPDALPDRVKGQLVKASKADTHNFGVLKLCGSGWKDVYLETVTAHCNRLNTPKFGQISSLLHDWLGVAEADLEAAWSNPRESLNSFVTLRGEIAHRGADAEYVRRDCLSGYVDMIDQFTIDTDNFLRYHISSIMTENRSPWNRIPLLHHQA